MDSRWCGCAARCVHPVAPAGGGDGFYEASQGAHLLLIAPGGELRVGGEGAADEGGDIAGEDVVGAGDAAVSEAEGFVRICDAGERV